MRRNPLTSKEMILPSPLVQITGLSQGRGAAIRIQIWQYVTMYLANLGSDVSGGSPLAPMHKKDR